MKLSKQLRIVKEKSSFKNIEGQLFEIKLVKPDNSKSASFKHYLLNHVKNILTKEYTPEKVTNNVAEEELQYLIFHFNKSRSFQTLKIPKFKFIGLFAGIGGFRLALQFIK